MIKRFIATATATFALAFAINVAADEADRRQALFGDVHIHTQLSFDAYIFGIRRTPDDAYRYALGETLRHAAGYDIALKGGPLDFYAVTDHAEYLGVLPTMNDPASSMSSIASAEGMFSPVFTDIITAFGKVFQSVTDGKEIEDMKAPGRRFKRRLIGIIAQENSQHSQALNSLLNQTTATCTASSFFAVHAAPSFPSARWIRLIPKTSGPGSMRAETRGWTGLRFHTTATFPMA